MFSIGKFADTCGVGVETIRFYQRKGLLKIPSKKGGMRHYGQEDVRRLTFIRKAQSAGFSLQEIKELISLDSSDDRPRARELAKARISALDTRIEELQEARNALKKLANECAHGKSGPCPILKSFDTWM
jgi:MerR family mercuric resistance operon transcriptional regulator